MYDYPGTYLQKADGEQYAAVRIDELGSQFELSSATTNAKGLRVGSLFTLAGLPACRPELRAPRRGGELRPGVQRLRSDAARHRQRVPLQLRRRCRQQQQFRPRRTTAKPFVQGPQTAVVVGPGGDEIYTDKYGRVKVQFHWDRYGKKDENSSCWIRVSHPWAGKGWGSVATPRIGQEVIVDFLEGDPDQPIITGRVYNAENQPPFGFPAGAVLSGVKSDTHKGAGFNEMSLDDTAGKERVFIHGQYNMDTVVEHDQTSTIHNCRTDRVDVDDSEIDRQQPDVGRRCQSRRDDRIERDADGGGEPDQGRRRERDYLHRVESGCDRGGERVADRRAAAYAYRGGQRDDHGRRGAGDYRRRDAGGDGGGESDDQRGVNQSTTVGTNQTNSIGCESDDESSARTSSTTVGADETHSVTGGRALRASGRMTR